jgi:hypothetical protein
MIPYKIKHVIYILTKQRAEKLSKVRVALKAAWIKLQRNILDL